MLLNVNFYFYSLNRSEFYLTASLLPDGHLGTGLTSGYLFLPFVGDKSGLSGPGQTLPAVTDTAKCRARSFRFESWLFSSLAQ